jgi:hypothetical protein
MRLRMSSCGARQKVNRQIVARATKSHASLARAHLSTPAEEQRAAHFFAPILFRAHCTALLDRLATVVERRVREALEKLLPLLVA